MILDNILTLLDTFQFYLFHFKVPIVGGKGGRGEWSRTSTIRTIRETNGFKNGHNGKKVTAYKNENYGTFSGNCVVEQEYTPGGGKEKG